MLKALTFPVVLLLTLFAASCGSDSSTSSTAPATSTTESSTSAGSAGDLAIQMTEFAFQPANAVVTAGDVTISATNDGNTVHELVLLKTDADPAKLPFDAGAVDESTSVGEIADVEPGASKSTTLKLDPGTYVMVCALPGHYEGGMYGSLTVK